MLVPLPKRWIELVKKQTEKKEKITSLDATKRKKATNNSFKNRSFSKKWLRNMSIPLMKERKK